MLLKNQVIFANVCLVMAIALYGFATNEPYWIENGHDPCLGDYLFWVGLAINGPSGFLADFLSYPTGSYAETRYAIQYLLWCALLWPQWRLYHRLGLWRLGGSGRNTVFAVSVFLIVITGGMLAYQAWIFGHRPSDFFVDQYFWFVRAAGIACSGLVAAGYAFWVTRRLQGIGEGARSAPLRDR